MSGDPSSVPELRVSFTPSSHIRSSLIGLQVGVAGTGCRPLGPGVPEMPMAMHAPVLRSRPGSFPRCGFGVVGHGISLRSPTLIFDAAFQVLFET
jgi:hypothetical protein